MTIPPVHPKDKNLLRPLSELGKPKYATGGHSFLRRTEYISTESSRSRDVFTPQKPIKPNKPRRQVDTSKEDPINILRSTIKGFDIAYPDDAYTGPDAQDNKIRGAEPIPAELEAWKNPKHPTNPKLKLLDAYPIKPDLDAMPEIGGYHMIKFTANPTPVTGSRDERLDVGLLHFGKELSDETKEAANEDFNAKMAAHSADPMHNPAPGPAFSYDLFLPKNEQVAQGAKRKFDVDNPQRDSDELYGNEPTKTPNFQFDHVRAYEAARSVSTMPFPYKEVALALHDTDQTASLANSDNSRLEKAAYYYPLHAKIQIKPRRVKNLNPLGIVKKPEADVEIDAMHVTIGEPDEEQQQIRHHHALELEADPEAGAEAE